MSTNANPKGPFGSLETKWFNSIFNITQASCIWITRVTCSCFALVMTKYAIQARLIRKLSCQPSYHLWGSKQAKNLSTVINNPIYIRTLGCLEFKPGTLHLFPLCGLLSYLRGLSFHVCELSSHFSRLLSRVYAGSLLGLTPLGWCKKKKTLFI